MQDLSKRQTDNDYSESRRVRPKTNAFVHPTDPAAVFPKRMRQQLLDFRSSAVEEAKTAGAINFRENKEPSKYLTKVWTAEQLKEQEMEEMAELVDKKLMAKTEQEENEKESENEEDMIESHFDQLKIGGPKKKDKKMKVADRSKSIRKAKKGKKKCKSYKIVNF